MKERPILFSGAMVRALLAGTKTQTRRVVKWRGVEPGLNLQFSGLEVVRSGSNWALSSPTRTSHEYRSVPMPCPYGMPADRLWVRENFYFIGESNETFFQATNDSNKVPPLSWGGPWKPSIHMPRRLCRIELEITDVRVERLLDISDEDAAAEGCPCYVCGQPMNGLGESDCHCFHRYGNATDYALLWESINGEGSWKANPWVWAVSFKVIKP
jgi:hypothetical protein